MIEETGTVVALEGNEVWIQTIRQSTCGSCSARKGCGQKALASISDGRANQVRVRNTLNVAVGQSVVIGIEESQLLRASLRVYAIPLVGLVAFALLAGAVWPDSEAATIGAGVMGLGLGFGLLLMLSRRDRNSDRFQPVMLKTGGAATGGSLIDTSGSSVSG
ncbi:SoxR reducing system RseC family protein [Marinobacter sp. 1Y8]